MQKRPKSRQEWEAESGMGRGARADALGDEEVDLDEEEQMAEAEEATGETREGWDAKVDEGVDRGSEAVREVERARERSRKGFDEVY